MPRKINRKLIGIIAALIVVFIGVVIVSGIKPSLFGAARPVEKLQFPEINVNTGPDTAAVPQHAAWDPVKTGPATCVTYTVYHSDQTGHWDLFSTGTGAGNGSVNISKSEQGDNISPSRSPDGQWVAFTSNRDNNWEIYIASTDGVQQRRVTYNTTAADIAPMWSPNGKYLAYETTRHGSRDLYLVDLTTGEEKRLTDNPAQDVNAFWSPDSTKLLFQSDRNGLWQIFELDILTNAVKAISDGKGNDLNPQYSSDGQQIAFRSYRDTTTSVVYVMHADGSNLEAISNAKGNAVNQVWSPDGKMIAYQSDVDGDPDIYVYQVAQNTTHLVTNNNVADFAPTWQCNSPNIVFSSELNGKSKLFEVPADSTNTSGNDIVQLTFGNSVDQFPLNSPAVEDGSRRGKVGNP